MRSGPLEPRRWQPVPRPAVAFTALCHDLVLVSDGNGDAHPPLNYHYVLKQNGLHMRLLKSIADRCRIKWKQAPAISTLIYMLVRVNR
jgi:hypothetical protein